MLYTASHICKIKVIKGGSQLSGFVQFDNQKFESHLLTPESYKYKNAKACKKSIAFAFFSYSETESKTYGVVNEYTVQNENKRCKK